VLSSKRGDTSAALTAPGNSASTPARSVFERGTRDRIRGTPSFSARGRSREFLLMTRISLFPSAGNTPAKTSRRGRIGDTGLAGKPGFGQVPCTLPVDQGFRSRDEFEIDCAHRHLVCGCRDFAAAFRQGQKNLRDSAGSWRRAPVNPNRGRRGRGSIAAAARVYLCWQSGRFGFAPAKGRAQYLSLSPRPPPPS
jgi:hypothetical protein